MNQQNHETQVSNDDQQTVRCPRGGRIRKKAEGVDFGTFDSSREKRLVADGGIDRLLYEELYVTVGFEERECPECDDVTEHRVEIDHNKGVESLECSVCNTTRESEHDETIVTDGGRDVELREGDLVVDAGQDTEPPAIVLRVTEIPAEEYTIEIDGEEISVSEHGSNAEYPSDSPIVLAAYLSSLEQRIIDELEAADERERIRLTRTIKADQDVPHYGFPSARLDVEDPVDGRDVPEGPLAAEESSHKYVTDGGIPWAETRPTDRREGDEIPPRRVECPYCEREGVTESEINLCHPCGRWFEVVLDGNPDAVERGERLIADGGDSATNGNARWHVDLGTGLGGWTAPFQDAPGWRSVGIDIRDDLRADVVGDIRALPIDLSPTLLTMSPPCTEFARWMLPWHDEPNPDLSLVKACLEAVKQLEPGWWVLENSRGLHQYWQPARKRVGPYYLWGEFPAFDVRLTDGGVKQAVSGEHPEERAKIPYALGDSLRRSVEWNAPQQGTDNGYTGASQ